MSNQERDRDPDIEKIHCGFCRAVIDPDIEIEATSGYHSICQEIITEYQNSRNAKIEGALHEVMEYVRNSFTPSTRNLAEIYEAKEREASQRLKPKNPLETLRKSLEKLLGQEINPEEFAKMVIQNFENNKWKTK